MLKKLSIRNFRLFEELEIEGLKRVNLIVGKNNTGKTTLLEAIRILEARGHSTVVNNILKNRGQFTPSWDESYYALFPLKKQASRNSLYINDLMISDYELNEAVQEPGLFVDFKVNYASYGSFETSLNSADNPDYPQDSVVYIPFAKDLDFLQKMWDVISLTPQEDEVVAILRKTIEPQLDRIDISGGVAKVKLASHEKPLPLKALGDGIQRLLLIALGLVSAKGKKLLIDEFESGLHYSVQETLWEFIFDYARNKDIQIFATTHSEDSLRAFYNVTSIEENQHDGFLFRLQYNREKKLEIIPYQIERLEKALEMDFEIR